MRSAGADLSLSLSFSPRSPVKDWFYSYLDLKIIIFIDWLKRKKKKKKEERRRQDFFPFQLGNDNMSRRKQTNPFKVNCRYHRYCKHSFI